MLKTGTYRCLAFIGPEQELVTVTDPGLIEELKKHYRPNAANIARLKSEQFPYLVKRIQQWFSEHKTHRPGKLYLHAN